MEPMTIFSWGYWGWGNATPQLLDAVDAVEAARDFRPPRFVDVRISRSVRAVGFRDSTFETLLGRDRYIWMPALGNRYIVTRTGPSLQIAEPTAADDLLDIAINAGAERRRLLFFCSCERPINDHGDACHRVEVARLIRAAAAGRGYSLQTVEWPGGEPTSIDLDVPLSVFRSAQHGRASLPLDKRVDLDRLRGLAWGTIVRLRHGTDRLALATGPARFQSGDWCLPVLQRFAGHGADGATPGDWAIQFREQHGYMPEPTRARKAPARSSTGGQSAVRDLSQECIYTIVHIDLLSSIEAGSGSGVLTESKPWTSGRRLLDQSRHRNLDLPIVFADATDCSRLLFWAIIKRIDTVADGTRYAFERLRPIPGRHAPQELVLLSSGKRIAPNYIRPYALCRTPAFLDAITPEKREQPPRGRR